MTSPVLCAGAGLATVLGLACGEPSGETSEPFDVLLPAPETLVSLESEVIGHPTDLALNGSGQLWIADVRAKRVVAIDPDGSVAQAIGREGQGPGEFQSPAVIAVNDTLVRVLDSRLMRVQDYDPDGRHLADHIVGSSSLGTAALSIDGRIVVPTMGRDSSLAAVHTVGDSSSLLLGPPVSPAPLGFDFTAMKAEIAEGRVPNQFRNQVTPIAGEDGSTWLVVQSESEIRKYSSDGGLAWRRDLLVPETEHARREFFRNNAEEENPARIHPLRTVVSAREVAGDIWLLMLGETEGESVIYVLSGSAGETLGRLRVVTAAPASQFAVDLRRERLYLAISDEASVLVVDLGGVGELSRLGN